MPARKLAYVVIKDRRLGVYTNWLAAFTYLGGHWRFTSMLGKRPRIR